MKIVSIAMSKKKGTRKIPVKEAVLKEEHGIEGDAHAGPWHRQVSFLASESIEEINQPQFSKSVGLIIKGYEALMKKDDKTETEQPEPGVEDESDEKSKSKANIFTNLKEKLNGIFEENDSAFD